MASSSMLWNRPLLSAWLVALILALCYLPGQIQAQGHNPYDYGRTYAGSRGFHSWAGRPPNYRQSYPKSAVHQPYGQAGGAAFPPGGGPGQMANLYTVIPELDKPTFTRNPRLIDIKPIRTQWQPNFLQPLPAEKLMAVALYPGISQNFSLPVKLDGNMAITVHPRRGFTTWNITYLDKELMVHPYFNSKIRQRMALGPHEQPVQAMPVVQVGKVRRKRCCIAGAVKSKSGIDVPSLDGGLGTSLGPGSVTYFKEDVAGGMYNLTTLNRGAGMAEIVVFTTLHPEFSPYPRIHGNDPQIKVRAVTASSVVMAWEAAPKAPDVSYCFIYHRAQDHYLDDVHSSSFAAWMERDTAVHLQCVKSGENLHNRLTINSLQPNTEYHIDLLSHNLHTKRETTFMGVQIRTSPGEHGAAYRTAVNPNPGRMPPYAGHTYPGARVRGTYPGFGHDPPPGYVDNPTPRRHIFSPPESTRNGRRPKMPVNGDGQFYNPANPYGHTVIPPTTAPMRAFTPKPPVSTRKPWYFNLVRVADRVTQQVKRYYAPRQWSNPGHPRTYREVSALPRIHSSRSRTLRTHAILRARNRTQTFASAAAPPTHRNRTSVLALWLLVTLAPIINFLFGC